MGQWFTTNVTITNNGDAWSSWEVQWNMTGDQNISDLWNGQHTQIGKQVSVSSYSWNSNIGTGSNAQFGFNGSYSAENIAPYDITVNGTLCSGQADVPVNEADSSEPETVVVCEASYVVREQWSTGFTSDIVIKNQGDALSGWNVTWTMPLSDQQVGQGWNGSFSQQDDQVAVIHASWNQNISSDGVIAFGFNGTYGDRNPIPIDIAVNGTLCSGQAEDSNTGTDPEPEEDVVCEASYVIREQWNTGFTSDITIKNQGSALSDWKVTWTMPLSDQQVGHGWNGSFSQQGDQVAVNHAGWNQNISSDGVIAFGFNGTYGDENPIPIDLAINGTQCSGQPDTVLVSPKAPSVLSAVMVDNTNAALSWDDNSDNEDAFIIERRQPDQSWQQLQQTTANVTSYEDETIGIGETYEYRVKANNVMADSVYSNTDTVTRQDHSQIGTQMLVDNCSSCHGTDGTSTEPAIPTIAGLDRDYIINTMTIYQSDTRASTIMRQLATKVPVG